MKTKVKTRARLENPRVVVSIRVSGEVDQWFRRFTPYPRSKMAEIIESWVFRVEAKRRAKIAARKTNAQLAPKPKKGK